MANLTFLFRIVKTLPCVAVFMSSLTIVSIAVDRYRIIVHSTARQVRCSRNIIAGIRSFSKLEIRITIFECKYPLEKTLTWMAK